MDEEMENEEVIVAQSCNFSYLCYMKRRITTYGGYFERFIETLSAKESLNWSDKAILITSIIFLLQPVEWYHYIANLINPTHQLPDLKVGEMYAEVAEYTQAGNFWDFIWGNVTLGQKATFRYDRKESPFLNKDTDYLRNLFCSSLCSEIVSAKAIRIGKSTPTPEYACPSHSRADSNRKHLTTRRTTV